MKIEEFKSRSELEAAIVRRCEERETLLLQRDKPYQNFNCDAAKRVANIERNIARLRKKLDEWGK